MHIISQLDFLIIVNLIRDPFKLKTFTNLNLWVFANLGSIQIQIYEPLRTRDPCESNSWVSFLFFTIKLLMNEPYFRSFWIHHDLFFFYFFYKKELTKEYTKIENRRLIIIIKKFNHKLHDHPHGDLAWETLIPSIWLSSSRLILLTFDCQSILHFKCSDTISSSFQLIPLFFAKHPPFSFTVLVCLPFRFSSGFTVFFSFFFFLFLLLVVLALCCIILFASGFSTPFFLSLLCFYNKVRDRWFSHILQH